MILSFVNYIHNILKSVWLFGFWPQFSFVLWMIFYWSNDVLILSEEQICQTRWAYVWVITAKGSLTIAAFLGLVPNLVLNFVLKFVLNFVPNFVLNFVPNFVLNFVPNFVLNFVPNFVLNFVPNFVLNFVLRTDGRTDRPTDKADPISDSLRRRLITSNIKNSYGIAFRIAFTPISLAISSNGSKEVHHAGKTVPNTRI